MRTMLIKLSGVTAAQFASLSTFIGSEENLVNVAESNGSPGFAEEKGVPVVQVLSAKSEAGNTFSIALSVVLEYNTRVEYRNADGHKRHRTSDFRTKVLKFLIEKVFDVLDIFPAEHPAEAHDGC